MKLAVVLVAIVIFCGCTSPIDDHKDSKLAQAQTVVSQGDDDTPPPPPVSILKPL